MLLYYNVTCLINCTKKQYDLKMSYYKKHLFICIFICSFFNDLLVVYTNCNILYVICLQNVLFLFVFKVVRAKTLANIPSSYKELHYILRECSAAICRDPETFKTVAKDVLRIDVSLLNKRSEYLNILVRLKYSNLCGINVYNFYMILYVLK